VAEPVRVRRLTDQEGRRLQHEDTVRDVIHRFNEIGPACLDPQWAGGGPPPTQR
jgi:hypothetical protein